MCLLIMSSPVLWHTQRRLLLCETLRLFQIFVFSICRIKPTVRNTCGRRMSEACQTDCSLVHTVTYFLLNWSTVKCFLPVMHWLFVFLHFCYCCCFMGKFSIFQSISLMNVTHEVSSLHEVSHWGWGSFWNISLRLNSKSYSVYYNSCYYQCENLQATRWALRI